jgi:hypothetical protein
MSRYHLSRFLFDLKMNDTILQRALADLDETMADYDLTDEEKNALRAGDPRRLREFGVHGMISLYLKRLDPKFRNNVYWTQK